jgi:dephospho-CoA kinase
MKNAIVLTGGIATGKSTAANMLIDRGFRVIDADKISREKFAERAEAIKAIFATLDRAQIAKRVFSNDGDRAKLEAILHPLIREQIFAEIDILEKFKQRYFVDIPLFFERRSEYPIADVALVYAPREMQIQRLIADRSASESEAIARINAQKPIDEKREAATWIIDNSKDLPNLSREVDRFLEAINEN